MDINRVKIGENIHFCSIIDKRYKTNSISLNFVTKLSDDTVSAYALIPALSKMLNGMYKADIES